jgi:hypothetical protein
MQHAAAGVGDANALADRPRQMFSDGPGERSFAPMPSRPFGELRLGLEDAGDRAVLRNGLHGSGGMCAGAHWTTFGRVRQRPAAIEAGAAM